MGVRDGIGVFDGIGVLVGLGVLVAVAVGVAVRVAVDVIVDVGGVMDGSKVLVGVSVGVEEGVFEGVTEDVGVTVLVGKAACVVAATARAVPVERLALRAVPVAWTEGSFDAKALNAITPIKAQIHRPKMAPMIQGQIFRFFVVVFSIFTTLCFFSRNSDVLIQTALALFGQIITKTFLP